MKPNEKIAELTRQLTQQQAQHRYDLETLLRLLNAGEDKQIIKGRVEAMLWRTPKPETEVTA